MPSELSFARLFACASVLAALGAGAALAAPQIDPAKSVFIDLTSGALPGPAPVPSAAPSDPSDRLFIDLTKDAAPVVMHVATGAPSGPDPGDPYEEENRARFKAHVALHRAVIDPVENTYMESVPEPARVGLHNVLINLETPTVFLNDIFQAAPGSATAVVGRFVINSTIGIGGIFDVASHIGLRYRDNDFGRTLAYYGVGDGPYLLIPVIGPSNPRDLGGKVVDFAMDPLHLITVPGGILTSVAHTGAHELDERQEETGELDDLARTAPDPYAAERQRARSHRSFETSGDFQPYQ